MAQNPMSWSKITIGTGDFTVNSKAIANTDWTLITAIPYREILSESIKIRNLLIFLMVVIGVVSYIVSFIISTSTTRRISLSKGRDFISIEDDVKHVKTYVEIQNLRFNNCIGFEVDVAEELNEYYILKLILQPIVENSVLHGILENREKRQGTIRLSGTTENGTVLLVVEDDGIGMTEEKAR